MIIQKSYFRKIIQLNRYICTIATKNIRNKLVPDKFIKYRLNEWNKLVKEKENKYMSPISIKKSIQIHKNDKVIEIDTNITRPIDILNKINNKNNKYIGVQINKNYFLDLYDPLDEKTDTLEFISFNQEKQDDNRGKKIFWRSASNVLGAALEEHYGDYAFLCDGPALINNNNGGFFYETLLTKELLNDKNDEIKIGFDNIKLNNDINIQPKDIIQVEKWIENLIKQKVKFQKLKISKSEAKILFKYSPFKLQLLDAIQKTQNIYIYKLGNFIDLCQDPNVPNTGYFGSFKLLRSGSSYWNSKSENVPVQRIYGIAFPDKKQLRNYENNIKLMEKNDHRIIGAKQELFFFDEMSPGSVFMLPAGTIIFNKLISFINKIYRKKNYQQVITPTIYRKELWEKSGHLENYSDDMYLVTPGMSSDKSDDINSDANNRTDRFGLKPMNCPGHCVMFKKHLMKTKYGSNDFQPIRLADFSPLHRNEQSGALTGLTRVRKFHQDDAHIFCTPNQVESEILDCLDFIKEVYGIFGFEFTLCLSTRPDKYIGSLEDWDLAENQLKSALDTFTSKNIQSLKSVEKYKIKEKDGAFYGPKIDVEISFNNNSVQCATIQLDFNLPERFELYYKIDNSNNNEDAQETCNKKKIILIHRAVLGSIERFMALIMEKTGGKWPFWLSPRQVAIVYIDDTQLSYAEKVKDILRNNNYYCDLLSNKKTLNKRIREAQQIGYHYIIVIGEKEKENNMINIRTRDGLVQGMKCLDDFLIELKTKKEKYL